MIILQNLLNIINKLFIFALLLKMTDHNPFKTHDGQRSADSNNKNTLQNLHQYHAQAQAHHADKARVAKSGTQ